MKPLIVYHKGCMDGAVAALAAWLKFGEDAEYRPASYGDSAPTDDEVRGRDVYVLDFSYPRAELVRMDAACAETTHHPDGGGLHVLDHHKTAQADLTGLSFCTFDMSKSGAVLAWEHFHVRDPARPGYRATYAIPELFAYVQDRDLWTWALPNSREVSAALAASGALTDFRKLVPIYKSWKVQGGDSHSFTGSYEAGYSASLVVEGTAILRAERLMIERIVATAEEVEFEYRHMKRVSSEGTCVIRNERVRALAATSAVLQSEVGEALAIESARRGFDAIGVVYYRDGASGKWRLSLRSQDYDGVGFVGGRHRMTPDGPDVSAIAKAFGGGGHARAAGCEVERLPWEARADVR